MPDATQDNSQKLWSQVLRAISQTVPVQAFNTWFGPLVLVAFDEQGCHLNVPSDYFAQGFRQHWAPILESTLAQLVSSACRLHIDVPAADAHSVPLEPWPVLRAADIQSEARSLSWLISGLWSKEAVGFVCGPPKSYKTWTVLEMAVSVASGTPCLGVFPVEHSGPVLLFAAEDPLPALRHRLEALAANHGLSLDQVDIRIIAVDALRLDRPDDRDKLTATVAAHRPVLLILDPLVRLHALDENQAGPMADLLSHLRTLQRSLATAIAIVHHARKNGAHSPGQNLRGSSDLYAFVDSLVLLQRRHGTVMLSAEHRSAPALAPQPLELVAAVQSDAAPLLRLAPSASESLPTQDPLQDRIIALLSAHSAGTADSIRAALQIRKQRVLEALRGMAEQGLITRQGRQYCLPSNPIASHHVQH